MNITDNYIDGREVEELVQRAKDEYYPLRSALNDLLKKCYAAGRVYYKRRGANNRCLDILIGQAEMLNADLDEEFEDIGSFEELYEEADRATGGHPEYAQIIAEDNWEDYVQQLMGDLGYLSEGGGNVLVIDWTATADNVANDYVHTTLDNGYSFYIR